MVNRDVGNEGNQEFPKEDVAIQRLWPEGISADVAFRLGKYFGMTPQFWMNLQADYDLRRAAATAPLSKIKPRSAK